MRIDFDSFSDIEFSSDDQVHVFHVDDSKIIRQIGFEIVKDEKRIHLVQAKNK